MPTIQSLPPELLHKVLALIQAEQNAYFSCRESSWCQAYTRDFTDIALVSKKFHNIASLYIYKRIILDSDNLPYFVRTIMSSVDLRPLVHDISLEFDTSIYARSDSPEKLDQEAPGNTSKSHAKKAFNMLEVPEEFHRDFAGDSPDSLVIPRDRYEPIMHKRLEQGRAAHQAEISLLLYLLPQLRSLRINTPEEEDAVAGENGEEEGFFRCKFLRGTLDLVQQVINSGNSKSLPVALRSLEEFEFHDPYQEPGAIKSTYPPILFWPLDWLYSVLHLPNLRKLNLVRAASEGNSPIFSDSRKRTSPLENLVLSSARIHVDALAQLLLVPKALRSFTFEVADIFSLINPYEDSFFQSAYISPTMLLSALKPHKDTLEYISIRSVQSNSMSTLEHACEMSDLEPDPGPSGPEDEHIFVQNAHRILPPLALTAFTNLRTASFHATDLLGIPYQSSRRLSDLLPQSLTHLNLRYDPLVPENQKSSFSEPFTHLFDLFTDKADGNGKVLPNLKSMTMNLRMPWYKDFDVHSRLAEEAQAVGIKLKRVWHHDVDYDPHISGAKPKD